MISGSSLFCARLHTTCSREHVADLFAPPTWGVHPCGWTDFEVTSPFAELVIEGESPILLHGPVTDVPCDVEGILSLLRTAEVTYTAEWYDVGGELQKEWRWGEDRLLSGPPRRLREFIEQTRGAFRIRFQLRTLMIAVAVVAVVLGAIQSVRMRDRSDYYLRRARFFDRLVISYDDPDIRFRPHLPKTELEMEMIQYWKGLRDKYTAAADRPWVPLPPDPPSPDELPPYRTSTPSR